jgi:hypothetical protein
MEKSEPRRRTAVIVASYLFSMEENLGCMGQFTPAISAKSEETKSHSSSNREGPPCVADPIYASVCRMNATRTRTWI